jgi:glutamyl-tRNA reductase
VNLLLVGLSHRTAPVEVRERYAVNASQLATLNEKLVQSRALDEAALLATCNRTEVIAVGRSQEPAIAEIRSFFHQEIGDGSASNERVYELRDAEVVVHLFEVSASLDSMVVGEAQILGQVKDAHRAAVAARSCGPVLNRLFQHSFRAAKRIRSETGLAAAPISVARVGVQLAREIFEPFEGKRVLLLGAGEMAESALLGLRDAGASDIVIVNRTASRADKLAAKLAVHSRPFEELEDALTKVDVVVTSVQVEEPVVNLATLRSAMGRRQGRPLLLIDLGLPRNVDPSAQELENVYLYDIDDLEAVAEQSRAGRAEAIGPAREIVAEECTRFERWHSALPLVPMIRELRELAEDLARGEAQRTASRLRGSSLEIPEALDRLAEAIVAKILHRPLKHLREEAADGTGYYAEAVRHLFGLKEDDS